MAISVGGAVKSSGGTGTTRSVAIPSGITDGDYWLIGVVVDQCNSALAAPGGWSQVFQSCILTEDDCRCGVFYNYYATAPVSAVNITGSGNEEWTAFSVYIREADPTTFLSGTAGTYTETLNSTTPVATAPNAGGSSGDLTLAVAWSRQPRTGHAAPTGMSTVADYSWNAGNGDTNIKLVQEAYVDDSSHTWGSAGTATDWGGTTFVVSQVSSGLSIPVAMHHRQQQGES